MLKSRLPPFARHVALCMTVLCLHTGRDTLFRLGSRASSGPELGCLNLSMHVSSSVARINELPQVKCPELCLALVRHHSTIGCWDYI